MLFETPDPDRLYQALVARDDQFDGRYFVCVSSTGIFCRLTCPARKPKRENCTFHETAGACLAAGYRPCKRCHPLGSQADADPMIGDLLAALERRPQYRWSEADVTRMGFDPSTVRRAFKRQFGMTFLEMARQRRLRDGFLALSEGEPVIAAQIDAGFSSGSAFREAFAKLLGRAPGTFSTGGLLRADWIDTPLGDMIAVSSASHLHLLEFVDRKALKSELTKLSKFAKGDIGIGRYPPTDQIRDELQAYFDGHSAQFSTPMALHGTSFTKAVWTELIRIPAGHTITYSQIAQNMGSPSAVRAVARANGANQIAIAIPCHRVVSADGNLTGYGGGLWRKRKLQEIELSFRPNVSDQCEISRA